MPDSETLAHIEAVRDKLAQVVAELMIRAREHDASKLQSPERDEFRAASSRLSALTYGSPEYEANKALLKDALEHHYRHNRHHPEHFERGVKGMTLIDLVEMFCDWAAASERHADGNLLRSIEIGQERFGLSDELTAILRNTALAWTEET